MGGRVGAAAGCSLRWLRSSPVRTGSNGITILIAIPSTMGLGHGGRGRALRSGTITPVGFPTYHRTRPVIRRTSSRGTGRSSRAGEARTLTGIHCQIC